MIGHNGNSRVLVQFVASHPGWHAFCTDKETRKALERAAMMGDIEINRFGQFRIRPPDIDSATGMSVFPRFASHT